MRNNKKAFTLVEMLVALAVSSIIIAATYASYELIQKQYKRNIDIAEMHTSGRSIMQVLEREVRMAGYEFRDANGIMTYGSIVGGLAITDSGNACCDEVTIIYDDVDDVVNAKGEVTSSSVERIKIRFWTEAYSSNKGDRFRLYKRKTILGRNNAILGSPIVGAKEVMADYVEDLQLFNDQTSESYLYTEHGNLPGGIQVWEPSKKISGYGKVIKTIVVSEFSKKRVYVCGLASDQKGFLFAGACRDGGIYKIDLSTGAQTKISSIDEVASLAYNTKNQKLYVGYGRQGRGGIKIINPDSGKTEDEIVTPIRCTDQVPGATALAFYQPLNLLYIGHSSHYTYVIIDPITKQCANYAKRGRLANTAVNGTAAAAGDSDGYMYLSGSGRLYAFMGTKFITDKNIAATLMNNGVSAGGSAATIGSVTSGSEALVTINLTLRAKNEYGRTSKDFLKKDYFLGNFNFKKNDLFKRDTFSTVVSVRNM
jgi:prepilin-type N-terminal cleavage/methylation domain-containing protein